VLERQSATLKREREHKKWRERKRGSCMCEANALSSHRGGKRVEREGGDLGVCGRMLET